MLWALGFVAISILLLASNSFAGGNAGATIESTAVPPSSAVTPGIISIAQAIATAEGFYVSGSLPANQNNPGDMTSGGTIATYPDTTTGWNALYEQILLIVNGQSHVYTASWPIYNPAQPSASIAGHWTTDVPPGAQANWGQNVAQTLGVDVSNSFLDYLGING